MSNQDIITQPTVASQGDQFGRKCTLLVSTASGNALDLSFLRIKFKVKRSDTMTPNIADIRVYNLSADTAHQISNIKNFTQVLLQCGYESNFGVIFKGNIRQVIVGRESATDTFIDIIAGDGDNSFNFTTVNTTLAAGSSQIDHINAALGAMKFNGVTGGYIDPPISSVLPRGKVIYDSAKTVMRKAAKSTNSSWSIQDEQVQFISQKAYLPGEAVVLTSKSGMIGTPMQTNEGVNVRCLLNPKIKIGGRIYINNASIASYKINLAIPNSPANVAPPLRDDGFYYVLNIDHTGDTRGSEYYSDIVCLAISIASNPINSVQVGYG